MLSHKAVWGALLIAVGFISLSGCAAVPGLRVSVSAGKHADASPAYRVIEITPEVISNIRQQSSNVISSELTSANTAGAPTEYVIGPGDVLQIVVWDHMELTNPFGAVTRDAVTSGQLVAADGTVFFPYVGILQAGGKTIQQVREYIGHSLTSVVNKPQVDVRVVAYRSARIQVTGEVKNPGVVTLDDTTKGLLEALNERGGLNPTASRRISLLIRDGKSYEIDLAGLLSGNVPAINPLLKAGDIVHIPDANNDQVFVLGELTRQGPVIMGQQQLTLTESLTKSGGMDRLTAADSGVLIFRRPQSPEELSTVYVLDLSRPEGLLLAGEFSLRPRDVVYVKATAFAQYNLVISQLLPTITAVYQIDALTK
jgi:polysaccharide biosynthesis/export protein